MIKGKQQRKRNRKLKDKAVPPVIAEVTVVSVTHGSSAVTVVFASPVMISPTLLPASWVYGASNREIVGITSSTGISYVFALSGTVAASDPYAMQGLDPAARTPTGGYVAASAGVLL